MVLAWMLQPLPPLRAGYWADLDGDGEFETWVPTWDDDDSDGDGASNGTDPWPFDYFNGEPGFWWDGVAYWGAPTDSDGDGIPDLADAIFNDADGDGTADAFDEYPNDYFDGQPGFWWDGVPYFQGGSAWDVDGDNIPDEFDPWPADFFNGQPGYWDAQGMPHWGEAPAPPAPIDSDGDGLSDDQETVSYFTNLNSWDTDGDGYADGDSVHGLLTLHYTGGVPDFVIRNASSMPNSASYWDVDGDGLSNWQDSYPTDPLDGLGDPDGDGIPDMFDSYPDDRGNGMPTLGYWTTMEWISGVYRPVVGDYWSETDTDGDGLPDDVDPLPLETSNYTAWWSGGTFWVDGAQTTLASSAYFSLAGLPDADQDGLPDRWDPYIYDHRNNTLLWGGGIFWFDGLVHVFDGDGAGYAISLDDPDGDGIPNAWDLYPLSATNNTSLWGGGTFWVNGMLTTLTPHHYASSLLIVDDDQDGLPDAWDYHVGDGTNNTSWWAGGMFWVDGTQLTLPEAAYATSSGLVDTDLDGIPDPWDLYPSDRDNNTSWWEGGDFLVEGWYTRFSPTAYATSAGLVDADYDGIPDHWDLFDEDDTNHSSWWEGGWVWQDGVYWLHSGGYYMTGADDPDGDGIPGILDWFPNDPTNNTAWWNGGTFTIDGQLVTFEPWAHQAMRTSEWGWTEPAVFDLDGDGLYDPLDPYMNDATNMGEEYILSSFDAITSDPSVTLDGAISGRPSLRRWLDTWFTSNTRWGSVPGYLRAGAPFAAAADYDGDGIPDVMELYFGLDPEDYNDAFEQPNGGEYTRLELYRAGQNLADPSDPLQHWQADYIPNVWKIHYEMDPLDPGVWLQNPDNDGYTNLEEYVAGYHPGIWDGVLPPEDSDADGFSDDAEVLFGMDPYMPLTLPGGSGAGTSGSNIALATHEIAHHFNIDGQPPDPPVPWRPGGGSGSSLPPASDPKDEYVIEVRWVALSTGDGADLHYGRRWVWRDEYGKRHEQSAGGVTGDAGSGADVRWEASDGRTDVNFGGAAPALASLPWRPLLMGEEVSGMHMYTDGGAYRALNNEESAVANARFALEMSALGSPGDPPVETAVLESGWYGRNGPLEVRLMSEVRLRRRSPEEIIAAGGTPPAEPSDQVVQFVDVKSLGQTTPTVTTPQLFLAHDGGLSQEKLVAPLSGQSGLMAVERLGPLEIKWEKIGDNWDIEDNKDSEGNWMPGRGKKFYPDAKSPDDYFRDNVHIKVKCLPNIAVYLRALDVDDPSGNSVIDPNGMAGDDNLTQSAGPYEPKPPYFGASYGSVVECHTDDEGVARTNGNLPILRVGTQPGDNYRVAVAFKSDSLSNLQISLQNSFDYVAGDSDQQPDDFSGRISSMLTIWRKLNVEVDSMSAPAVKPSPDRQLANAVGWDTAVSGSQGQTRRTVIITSLPTAVPKDFYAGGYIKRGNLRHRIKAANAHSEGASLRIELWKELSQGEIDSFGVGEFEIVDDDDITFSNGMSDVLPRTDLITPQVRKIYCDVYIDIVRAPESLTNTDVPFLTNVPTNLFGNAYVPSDAKAKATIQDSRRFWGHTAVACYQSEKSADMDPSDDPDRGIYGETFSPLRISMIYIENIVDSVTLPLLDPPGFADNFEIKVSNVVAHEIAHVPGSGDGEADHSEDGLMAPITLDADEAGEFAPKTLRRLRLTPSWRPQ